MCNTASAATETFYPSAVSNVVATRGVWLSRAGNVASAAEKLSFSFYFTWPVATLLETTEDRPLAKVLCPQAAMLKEGPSEMGADRSLRRPLHEGLVGSPGPQPSGFSLQSQDHIPLRSGHCGTILNALGLWVHKQLLYFIFKVYPYFFTSSPCSL